MYLWNFAENAPRKPHDVSASDTTLPLDNR